MFDSSEGTVEEAADRAAGNWDRFESFVWDREFKLDRPEDWAIFYTRSRDSRLTAASNAVAIAEALQPFAEGDDPDVVFETHDHWASGWVSGFSVRVRRDGEVTPALENIAGVVRSAFGDRLDDLDLPARWRESVWAWFRAYRDSAVENVDDADGYPTEDDVRVAFAALGWVAHAPAAYAAPGKGTEAGRG